MERQIVRNPVSILDRIINWSGIIIWVLICALLIFRICIDEILAGNALAYLAIVGPAIMFGILSLCAGIGLLNVLTPFFCFSELFQGDGLSKLSGAIILAGILLSLALIINGAN